MKIYRSIAIAKRYLKLMYSDFNRLASIVYWPAIDILLFGLAGQWFAKTVDNVDTQALLLLFGIVSWQLFSRANFGISINLLEEIWSNNILYLFSSPLQTIEWIAGAMLEGITLFTFTLFFSSLFTYAVFGINYFKLGYFLLLFLPPLFFAGATVGLLCSSILIRYGKRIQTIAWMFAWILGPVSGAFYPVSLLPNFLQKIAYCLPLAHIFDSMSIFVQTKAYFSPSLGWAYVLTTIFFILAIKLFAYNVEKSRRHGLTSLQS